MTWSVGNVGIIPYDAGNVYCFWTKCVVYLLMIQSSIKLLA